MATLLTISCRVRKAFDLLKKDTLASYYAAAFQFAVGKVVSEHIGDSLNITVGDLNEEGMKIYNTIQEKIDKEEWEKKYWKTPP